MSWQIRPASWMSRTRAAGPRTRDQRKDCRRGQDPHEAIMPSTGRYTPRSSKPPRHRGPGTGPCGPRWGYRGEPPAPRNTESWPACAHPRWEWEFCDTSSLSFGQLLEDLGRTIPAHREPVECSSLVMGFHRSCFDKQ